MARMASSRVCVLDVVASFHTTSGEVRRSDLLGDDLVMDKIYDHHSKFFLKTLLQQIDREFSFGLLIRSAY